MNMMPVLVDWCKQTPSLFLQRYSSLFIHYIFSINEVYLFLYYHLLANPC